MSPKENNLIDRGCTLLLTETIPLRSPTGNNLVSTLALAEPISPRKRSWTKNDLIENGNDSLLIRLRNSATSYSKYSGYYPGFNYKITHIPIYLRRLLADLSISGIDDFRLTVGKFNQLLKLLAWIYKINSPPPQIEDKIWTVFSNQLRFVLPKAVCRPSFPGFFISLESVLYSAAFQITQNRDLDQVYHNVMVYTFDPIISCLSAIDMSACFNILKSFLECIQNIIIFLLLRKNRLWYSHNAMEDPDTRTELLELVKGKELNHSSTSCLVDHLKIIESIQIEGNIQ